MIFLEILQYSLCTFQNNPFNFPGLQSKEFENVDKLYSLNNCWVPKRDSRKSKFLNCTPLGTLSTLM